MRPLGILALAMLSACGSRPEESDTSPPDLETAAIERGLLPDPKDSNPVGLYARDTDRICVVEGKGGYRVGVTTDFGDGVACDGSARGALSGDRLALEFGEACRIDASFKGERVTFPGKLPVGCATLCHGRASLSGIEVARLSNSESEARAMRGANGKLLCAGD